MDAVAYPPGDWRQYYDWGDGYPLGISEFESQPFRFFLDVVDTIDLSNDE